MEPEDIQRKEFLISLRGYDRDEVDAFLHEIAEELRRLKAPPPATQPAVTDREAIYRQVGEETAKILMAAEDAGRQIQERSQREGAQLISDARAQTDDILRQAAAERKEAEEDLRRLREARSLLATQLQDVRQRLDEITARLAGPIEAPPPKRPRARKAEAQALSVPVTPPTTDVAPPPAKVEPTPAPARVAPTPAPARVAPTPAPTRVAPSAPAAAAPSARLQGLLDQARREREEARREIDSAIAQGPAAAVETTPAPAAPVATITAPADATEVAILHTRDRALGDAPAATARRLKRLLQEDQNDLLDRIRTSRGKGAFEQDISPAEAQLNRFREGLRESLETAFEAGRRTAGGDGRGKASAAVGDLITKQIVNPLRREVGRVVEAGLDAQDTATSIAGRASDVFRVWKGVRTELLGEGLAHSAFHHGMLDAWRDQKTSAKRWVGAPDEGECPREVCASNAAAGAVPVDESFPSGHLAPPAHGGCTCSLSSD